MKASTVRKIYPYLCDSIKNRKWRSLTEKELDALMAEKQVISNCYDVATRYALLNTKQGRDCLLKRIKLEDGVENPHCKVIFNINGKNKSYVSCSNTGTLGDKIASAVEKMIHRNPGQKPFVSRFGKFGFHRACEFNYPSNAFQWYTGKKPISIGENELNFNLKPFKDRVLKLLNFADDDKLKDHAIVVISSHKPEKVNGHRRWHCLPVIGIDHKNKTLKIINKRTDEVISLSFDELINKFKSIVGINLAI